MRTQKTNIPGDTPPTLPALHAADTARHAALIDAVGGSTVRLLEAFPDTSPDVVKRLFAFAALRARLTEGGAR